MNTKNNKMLTNEQCETVKMMIVGSMRSVYAGLGTKPGDDFEKSANFIANEILKKSQMALMQNEVFEKIIKGKSSKKGKK